jgi:hypothetical protein
MRRSPIEPFAVVTTKYRSLATFADREIDRSRRPRHERDHGRLAALANDVQGAMTAFESQILDVGPASFRDSETVQP